MKYVKYSVKDRIGYITLSRPEKRNALNFEVVSELKGAFTFLETDEAVKVIILNAEGDAFCAGADLDSLQKMQDFTYEENLQDSRHLKELFFQIYTLRKIVIAQIQGHAIAGGCGLATVCDFSFTTPEAKFGYTEVKIGFIPALVMVFLIRKIGEKNARQMLLTGELVTGPQAAALGMVNFVVAKEELTDSVLKFATNLVARNSLQSMELTKKMIAEVQGMPLEQALEHAAGMNAASRRTEDFRKGLQAFLDKKDQVW